jgi:hypothetical protein
MIEAATRYLDNVLVPIGLDIRILWSPDFPDNQMLLTTELLK